ncbi:hypothetical protein L7F22_046897 [Adiantum nelumboides]|nr:hypothetical protein [Adiantum nelumboides]
MACISCVAAAAALMAVLCIMYRIPIISCNSEGDTLHQFRLSLVDPANVLQSWDPTLINPCTWFHVTCNQDQAVTRIDLGNANLAGPLIAELANLEHLQYLELYGNNLTGKIPSEFGKLKNLVSLDLYNNRLSGSIPKSLGNLKLLTFLRLHKNRLTGRIPWSLTTIPDLKVVDVSSNDLCGTIPMSGSFEHVPLKSFENNVRLNGPELFGSGPYTLVVHKVKSAMISISELVIGDCWWQSGATLESSSTEIAANYGYHRGWKRYCD